MIGTRKPHRHYGLFSVFGKTYISLFDRESAPSRSQPFPINTQPVHEAFSVKKFFEKILGFIRNKMKVIEDQLEGTASFLTFL